MKKLKLNLAELELISEVIENKELKTIKGGYDWLYNFYNTHGEGTYSGAFVDNWYDTNYYSQDPWGNYGGYGAPNNPLPLAEVIVTGSSSNSSSVYDAISLMLSSLGLAADHAQVAAAYAGITSKGIQITGTAFGVLSVGQNIYEIASGDGDALDYAQAGAGLMLLGAGGGFLIAGGALLAASELYEMVTDPNSPYYAP
ncbi:hypothetical protein [Pedobacter glucosidilyticus]|uniref:hypothetical protein n=1 Tax=Pedobacter glucosidilyticus TaxID=1122941 RepID=UPI0026F0F7AB|nr:hypothetical protein [Pedobacter glucosidilyticus]